jgi:hypothetical protein
VANYDGLEREKPTSEHKFKQRITKLSEKDTHECGGSLANLPGTISTAIEAPNRERCVCEQWPKNRGESLADGFIG